MKLNLLMEGTASAEEMNANVAATLARGSEPIEPHFNQYPGAVAICGAAPSLRETHSDIPLDQDILAVNSALGFLLERGRVPRWAMIWDAAEICERFAVPHDGVTYLIGARCHPKVFERLRDCRVIAWHAGGDHNIVEFLSKRGINVPLINGGSAGVTRAIYLAYALGKREMHLHGADSSRSETGETHIRGSLVEERDLRIFMNGRYYQSTPEWCAQIEEFKLMWPLFHHHLGANFTVHGSGLLPDIAALLQQIYAAQPQSLGRAA